MVACSSLTGLDDLKVGPSATGGREGGALDGAFPPSSDASSSDGNDGRLDAAQGDAGGCPDPNWSSVVLLMHMDSVAQFAQPFVDESPSHHVLSRANGGVVIDTVTPKYGAGSALFDGTSGYLTTPDSP